jgi:hypothetical protein
MKILKDLALALCNATLVLLIILTGLAVVLFGRVNGLRDNTGSVVNQIIQEQSPRIDLIAQQLQRIDQKLEQADNVDLKGIKAELAGIRKQMPDLSSLDETTLRSIVQQLLIAIRDNLSMGRSEAGTLVYE